MSKPKLVLASANKSKIKEISDMLPEFEVISYRDFGLDIEIEETGTTFYENALIKAQTVAKALNVSALADDSGICVEHLNGAPGIYSARYAGDGIDEHNNRLLLKNMQGVNNRKAKFVCCMVYCTPEGKIISSYGETEGYLMTEPHGDNGFGYDPIFFSTEINKCLGEATEEEKNAISHRFRAIKGLREKL